MKILHILDHSLPLHSGYTFRSQNIFKSQIARGWIPLVVTSPKHEQSRKIARDEDCIIEGVKYFRTGMVKSTVPFVGELILLNTLFRNILKVSAREKPDILHAHSPVLNAIPALWAGKKLGLPVVYEIRAFWEDAAVDHGTYAEGSWKYLITRWMETWACKKADHVAILCNGLKQDLIKRGIPASKITPVFNGVNVDDFKECPPHEGYRKEWSLEGKLTIGFIGSFYHYEGLDLLLQAFARIIQKRPETRLLLVGGGQEEPRLRQTAEELKLTNSIIMPGRIPHQDIPGIYALTDILAYPRYPMRLTELVTPLKPLEAMAMGKVLVASDVGGHRELITDNQAGLLFKAGSVDHLTGVLLRLVDDVGLRQRIAGTARIWVQEHHAWERTTRVYQGIYDSILGHAKRPSLAD